MLAHIQLYIAVCVIIISLYVLSRHLGINHSEVNYAIVYTVLFVTILNIIVYSTLLIFDQVDYCGNEPGYLGQIVNHIVRSTTDIEFEGLFLICIFAMAYFPPIAAYLWLGLFGVAKWKSPLVIIPNLIILSFVKFGALWVGINLSVVIWRSVFKCPEETNTLDKILSILIPMVGTLFVLFIYKERYIFNRLLKRILPKWVTPIMVNIKMFFERNIKNENMAVE